MSIQTTKRIDVVCDGDGCKAAFRDLLADTATVAREYSAGAGWTTVRRWGQPVRDLCPNCTEKAPEEK